MLKHKENYTRDRTPNSLVLIFFFAYYDPCVVRTEAPSERSDDTGEGVGRLPGRQDDEHGEEGLHGLGCVLVVLHIKTYTIRHAVESRAARSYACTRAHTRP